MKNWFGNHEIKPKEVHNPVDIAELATLIKSHNKIRPLGTKMSFSPVVDIPGCLVEVGALPIKFEIDKNSLVCNVSSGMTLEQISSRLLLENFELETYPSRLDFNLIGAIATGSHGSGLDFGILGAAVKSLTVIDADGKIRKIDDQDPLFHSLVVSLGACGIVISTELRIRNAENHERFKVANLSYGELISLGSLFLDSGLNTSLMFNLNFNQRNFLLVKYRQSDRNAVLQSLDLTDSFATFLPGGELSEVFQLEYNQVGKAEEIYPHLGKKLTGIEDEGLQSEYYIPFQFLKMVLDLIVANREFIRYSCRSVEIRSIKKDNFTLSGAYGTDVFSIHFTWREGNFHLLEIISDLEKLLQSVCPETRPHWGKVFISENFDFRRIFPNSQNFVRTVDAFDGSGKFSNQFIDDLIVRF